MSGFATVTEVTLWACDTRTLATKLKLINRKNALDPVFRKKRQNGALAYIAEQHRDS